MNTNMDKWKFSWLEASKNKYVVKHGEVPRHAMKAYGRVEALLYSFLTSALEEGERLALCPNCLTAWESAPVKVLQ
jgi:hypothetical protein